MEFFLAYFRGPRKFWEYVRFERGWKKPILRFLGLFFLSFVPYVVVDPPPLSELFNESKSSDFAGTAFFILFALLFAAAEYFLSAVAVSLSAKALGSDENFEKGLKLIVYTLAPYRFFSYTPQIAVVLGAYGVILFVVGFKELFQVNYERAIVALGLTGFFIYLLRWVLGFAGTVGLIGAVAAGFFK